MCLVRRIKMDQNEGLSSREYQVLAKQLQSFFLVEFKNWYCLLKKQPDGIRMFSLQQKFPFALGAFRALKVFLLQRFVEPCLNKLNCELDVFEFYLNDLLLGLVFSRPGCHVFESQLYSEPCFPFKFQLQLNSPLFTVTLVFFNSLDLVNSTLIGRDLLSLYSSY